MNEKHTDKRTPEEKKAVDAMLGEMTPKDLLGMAKTLGFIVLDADRFDEEALNTPMKDLPEFQQLGLEAGQDET